MVGKKQIRKQEGRRQMWGMGWEVVAGSGAGGRVEK